MAPASKDALLNIYIIIINEQFYDTVLSGVQAYVEIYKWPNQLKLVMHCIMFNQTSIDWVI